MNSKIEFSNPCNQDWNLMENLDGNRFCDKCQKEVVDLTSYSKKDLFEKLKIEGEVCGRLDRSQLNFNYSTKTGKNKFVNKVAVFIGLGSIIGFTEPMLANSNTYKVEQRESTQWESVLPKKMVNDTITITGKVMDLDGNKLPGANVVLKGTEIGVSTDLDGKFLIKIPTNELGEKNYLIFSYIGYERIEYRFYKKNRSLKIQMAADASVLGGITFVQERNIFQKAGHFFSHIFSSNKSFN